MMYSIYLPDLLGHRENKTELCILTIFNLPLFFLTVVERGGGGVARGKRDGMLVGKKI